MKRIYCQWFFFFCVFIEITYLWCALKIIATHECGVFITWPILDSLKSTLHFTNKLLAIFNCSPLCSPSSPQPFSVWGGTLEEPEERRPTSPECEIFWWKHGILLLKHYLSVEYFDENITLAINTLTKTLADEYQIIWESIT